MKQSSIWSRKFSITQLFLEKKWKSIKSLFTFFTKRSFFWFDLFSQTFLSIRNGFVHLWKKKQQWKQKKNNGGKKRKGRAFKLFFVTSCLYATFFNLRASSLHKNLSFAFPHRKKKWKIETIGKFNFRRFVFNPFHYKQAILTKQNSPNRFWRTFGYFHQQGFISSFLPCFCKFKLLTRVDGIIVGKIIWTCVPLLVVVININGRSFWCILSWLCNCSKNSLYASSRNF